jgi:hypothetical protein
MGRKVFWNVLFLSLWITLVFMGWQTATVDAEPAKVEGVSSGDEAKADSNKLDLILLNNQGYKKKRKGPVEFTHKKHVYEYKVFCWNCHHDYKDGQNVWVPGERPNGAINATIPRARNTTKSCFKKRIITSAKGVIKTLLKK